MKALKILATAAAMVALTGAAQAALISQGDGTVKDTNTNLIWLRDWNVNGAANWSTQKAWAEGLTYAGSSDWVLPTATESFVLATAYGDLRAVTEFTNVQSAAYWAGDQLPLGFAVAFFPNSGSQSRILQSGQLYAVAVRPGDVAASVPEPQTLALALLALGATVMARRRRPR